MVTSPSSASASPSLSAAPIPPVSVSGAGAPRQQGSNASPPLSIASAAAPGGAGAAQTPTGAALETYRRKDTSKIVVRFKAIGNAPIMKNNYFRITAFNRFHAVVVFLRKELGWKSGDALFLYINSSFAPAPDDTVGNLYRCFGTEGHLIVNYSTQAAWG